SSHRRGGLAPRCRLIASWGCSRSQGLGCSPIKAVRELGSERRETVRPLSVAGVGNLRGSVLSTRGPGWTYRWCTSCSARSIAGSLRMDEINAESILLDAPPREHVTGARGKHALVEVVMRDGL